MYQTINTCRICGCTNLQPLLNIGEQSLTGVFPKSTEEYITSGPLELVKCHPNQNNPEACGLVQLHHSYSLEEMYGMNYGYRSSLNQSMVKHLQGIVSDIIQITDLKSGDLILDIGSNDSTTLRAYPQDKGYAFVGIDPTGIKFQKYYPEYMKLIPDFFSAEVFKKHFPERKAKVITSIAMFYDLEQPFEFVKQISEILADDGVWVCEQSYLPSMLSTYSYDTICHEHLEFYSLTQIKWMFERADLKILDVELNNTNGGSFKVTAGKTHTKIRVNQAKIDEILYEESHKLKLDSIETYQSFSDHTHQHRQELVDFVHQVNAEGKKIFGYGASTKGNVLLQFCGFTPKDIPYIAEVNEDKFGSYTPFTHIPIISEQEAIAMQPDYFLVLPWHFKQNFIEKGQNILEHSKFVFPLPHIEIVGK
jgi:hypothetical protein